MTVQDVINTLLAGQLIEIYEEQFVDIMYIGDYTDTPNKYRKCPVLCMEIRPSGILRLYIS